MVPPFETKAAAQVIYESLSGSFFSYIEEHHLVSDEVAD